MGLQKTVLPKEVSDQLTTEEELEAVLQEHLMVGPDADNGEVAPATADIELEAVTTTDTEQERAADFENQQAETCSIGPYNISDMDVDVDPEEIAREKTGEEDELQETEDDKRLTDNAAAETCDRQMHTSDDSSPGPIAEHITNIRLCRKDDGIE